MLNKILYGLILILYFSSCSSITTDEKIKEIKEIKTLSGGIYSTGLTENEIKNQLQIDSEKFKSDKFKEEQEFNMIFENDELKRKEAEKAELDKHILADKNKETLELLEIEKQVELDRETSLAELEKRALEDSKIK